jgi:hypothetical protein
MIPTEEKIPLFKLFFTPARFLHRIGGLAKREGLSLILKKTIFSILSSNLPPC